jgi:hypothetical protein
MAVSIAVPIGKPAAMRLLLASTVAAGACALAQGGVAAPAAATVRKPVCAEASHATLKVQPGRDVCSATVLPHAGPVAVGYLPTACPRQAPELAVDASGPEDLCRGRAAAGGRPNPSPANEAPHEPSS